MLDDKTHDGMTIIFQQKVCVQIEHEISILGIIVIVYQESVTHNVIMYEVIQKLVLDQVEIGMLKMVCEEFGLSIVRA
jgi:hypothetical protein